MKNKDGCEVKGCKKRRAGIFRFCEDHYTEIKERDMIKHARLE